MAELEELCRGETDCEFWAAHQDAIMSYLKELKRLRAEVRRVFKSVALFEAIATHELKTNSKSYPLIRAALERRREG